MWISGRKRYNNIRILGTQPRVAEMNSLLKGALVSERTFNVAVVGAGPAGIYAADILSKSELSVNIDLFERLPAPYGLVRYGVAPDHPRIRAIIDALYKILQRGDIQLFANVNVGTDITVEELQERYDAIIFATGSDRDKPM